MVAQEMIMTHKKDGGRNKSDTRYNGNLINGGTRNDGGIILRLVALFALWCLYEQ